MNTNLNLQQGSEEWLQYRQLRIGATDFANYCSYLKLSPKGFTTLNQSLKDKVLMTKKDNYFMQYGRDNEERLRIQSNRLFEINGIPQVRTYHANKRIMSSLDSLDDDAHTLIEIKTTGKDIMQFADTLLKYYFYQIVHQFYCCGGKQNIQTAILYGENRQTKQEFYHIFSADEIINTMSENVWYSHCEDYLVILDNFIEETKQ